MGKEPAFFFYPGDWMQDTRSLSLAAKGAWIDLLCAMWRSPTRGRLTLPWIGYARLLSGSLEQVKAAITELTDMRICDCEIESNVNVTLINRRMEREQRTRELTRYRVEKHRNAVVKRTSNDSVTVPSSKSSKDSSSKDSTPKDRARTSPRHRWPPEFVLTDELRAKALELGVEHPDAEFSHFRDHHTAKGSTMADWNAAWSSWCRKARQFAPRHDQPLGRV